MKKILSAVALAVCFVSLFSCRKDNQAPNVDVPPSGDTTLHSVQLNVSSFEAQYANMRVVNLQNDSAQYLKYLYTAIYDATGRLVQWREQLRGRQTDADFGRFNWLLASGTYSVVFVSTTDTLAGSHYLIAYKADSLAGLQIKNYWDNGGLDVFYNKSTLVVGNQDTAVNNIQLSRISGKIEVRFKDNAQLLDSAWLAVSIKGYPAGYSPGSGYYAPSFAGDSIRLKQVSSGVYEGFCLGSSNKIRPVFNGYFYSPVTGYTPIYKVLNNVDVYIYPNKRTVLSGYLSGLQSGGADVSADTDFSGTIFTSF